MNIGIIGCGKLGICYIASFAKAGFNCYCYDINKNILNDINNNNYNYYEPHLNDMLNENKNKLIISYNLKDVIDNCDIIFTFINTPSLFDGSYNHKYLDQFIDNCLTFGKVDNRKIIVISSTVSPEYCDTLFNKLDNFNYDICYNPSFIAQGSIIANITNPEFLIIGANNDNCFDPIIDIHKKIISNPNVSFNKMKLYEAEITKIVNNCFITMKISFVNLIGDLIKSKNYNPQIVLDALSTNSNFGKINMKYGFGYGGPCLPRDNKAFYNYIENNIDNEYLNFDLCLINDRNNKNHLLFQFEELKKSKDPIEFKFITYKDTSNLLEASQKLELALLLAENGNKVIIYERPEIIQILDQKYPNLFELRNIDI